MISRYVQAVTGALNRAVVEILRMYTEDSFVSQIELGRLSGISQSQISKLFRGERRLTLDQLEAMCHALRLSVVAVIAEASREIPDERRADPRVERS